MPLNPKVLLLARNRGKNAVSLQSCSGLILALGHADVSAV